MLLTLLMLSLGRIEAEQAGHSIWKGRNAELSRCYRVCIRANDETQVSWFKLSTNDLGKAARETDGGTQKERPPALPRAAQVEGENAQGRAAIALPHILPANKTIATGGSIERR